MTRARSVIGLGGIGARFMTRMPPSDKKVHCPHMSDEAYALVMALTCIAYLFVLYHRFRQGRAIKRLTRLLEESGSNTTPPAENPPHSSTQKSAQEPTGQ